MLSPAMKEIKKKQVRYLTIQKGFINLSAFAK